VTSFPTRTERGAPGAELTLAFDREHVWHPYGPLPSAIEPLLVDGADGVRIALHDGRELIDGMASWWCAIHGYRHPALDAALEDQLARAAHVMFGGLTHEPAVRLAERLLELVPPQLDCVFFADSGSVSVEVAIKMCIQYQRARGYAGRTRLLTVRGGYHGDTLGAMAVCDPVGGMHSAFSGVLAEHLFAERPPDGFDAPLDERWAAGVAALFARNAGEVAAAIIEPIVQGAGGMRFHSPACVALMRDLCDEHGALLVLDEVATGFGRTGAMFACEHAGIAPDIMCVGKALTGGYMTLAATLCTRAVADAISASEPGALMHGPTFMANPLACSVALASLELLAVGEWRDRVRSIERCLSDGLRPARALPHVADVRVLGAIGVVQLEREVNVAAATAASVAEGVWLRPFRDLVYTMPPYVIDEPDLARVAAAAVAAAEAGGRD
jgi:adenosylmethionine-8-amino-7-oxononanoate aminotransferase